MKCIANKKILLVILLLSFVWYFIRYGPIYLVWFSLSQFQGPLGKRDKHVEFEKDAGLREERTEIRDTAGALQTFSGKRKLVETLLRVRLTKN